MPRVSGVVESVEARTAPKSGQTFYIVTVNGKKLSLWGKQTFAVGNTIEFDEMQKGNFLNMGNPQVVAAGEAPKAPQAQLSRGYNDPEREARIVRQNATSTAAALIAASKIAGKQDIDTLLAVLRETSKRIFQMNMEGYEATEAAGKKEAQVKADAEELFGT